MKGIYCLLISLHEDKTLMVGKRRQYHFQRGNYVYIGSALNNLEKRLARHLKKNKKKHWHIDYLLEYANIVDVITFTTTQKIECQVARLIAALPNSKAIPQFGCSDCTCISHLYYLGSQPKQHLTSTQKHQDNNLL
jgi:Uri superfamily endonuclease